LISTPEPTRTITLIPTPHLDKTRQILATGIAGATQTAQQNQIDCKGQPARIYFSPQKSQNGDWRTTTCIDSENGYQYTRIIQTNGTKAWNVSLYEAFVSKKSDETTKKIFKDGEMSIIHWSANGKYVYLSPYFCCLDGPVLFNGIIGLYQLNLDTGQLKDMSFIGGRVGFSPDDKYLAYRTLPATAHLRNLETGEDISVPVSKKYVNLGGFSWSPDSQKVLWVGALEDWDKNMYEPTPVNQNGFSILMLNIETMKMSTLIDNDIRFLIPSSPSYYENQNTWADDHHIYLSQMNIAGRDEAQIWLYDINTKKITPFSTPTPTPVP
jgi:WD40 repeat protein